MRNDQACDIIKYRSHDVTVFKEIHLLKKENKERRISINIMIAQAAAVVTVLATNLILLQVVTKEKRKE